MKYHPPIYYTIRTIVRGVFWGTLAFLSLWLIVESTDDDRPYCDVAINFDFTWEWQSEPTDLSSCRHPELTILNPDGTWDWVQERL